MAISDWPESEQPREKFFTKGASSLSDAELLALFIGTGNREFSALALARGLLDQFGSLAGLMRASTEQLLRVPGLGQAKVARLKAITECASRSALSGLQRGAAMTSPGACRNYLKSLLSHENQEIFWALMLDNQHRILHSAALSRGTLDAATIYPREVVRACLEHHCAAVIFAHNHPSGSLEPSLADREITKRLKNALKCVDIRLLDHFIVSDRGIQSMAELGMI